jgi:hypothetical protein
MPAGSAAARSKSSQFKGSWTTPLGGYCDASRRLHGFFVKNLQQY